MLTTLAVLLELNLLIGELAVGSAPNKRCNCSNTPASVAMTSGQATMPVFVLLVLTKPTTSGPLKRPMFTVQDPNAKICKGQQRPAGMIGYLLDGTALEDHLVPDKARDFLEHA